MPCHHFINKGYAWPDLYRFLGFDRSHVSELQTVLIALPWRKLLSWLGCFHSIPAVSAAMSSELPQQSAAAVTSSMLSTSPQMSSLSNSSPSLSVNAARNEHQRRRQQDDVLPVRSRRPRPGLSFGIRGVLRYFRSSRRSLSPSATDNAATTIPAASSTVNVSSPDPPPLATTATSQALSDATVTSVLNSPPPPPMATTSAAAVRSRERIRARTRPNSSPGNANAPPMRLGVSPSPIYIYPGLLRIVRDRAIALDNQCPAVHYKCSACRRKKDQALLASMSNVPDSVCATASSSCSQSIGDNSNINTSGVDTSISSVDDNGLVESTEDPTNVEITVTDSTCMDHAKVGDFETTGFNDDENTEDTVTPSLGQGLSEVMKLGSKEEQIEENEESEKMLQAEKNVQGKGKEHNKGMQEPNTEYDNSPAEMETDVADPSSLSSLSSSSNSDGGSYNLKKCPHAVSCPICLEDFHSKDLVRKLPCNSNHVFHSKCILDWFVSHQRCPLCNQSVVKSPAVQPTCPHGHHHHRHHGHPHHHNHHNHHHNPHHENTNRQERDTENAGRIGLSMRGRMRTRGRRRVLSNVSRERRTASDIIIPSNDVARNGSIARTAARTTMETSDAALQWRYSLRTRSDRSDRRDVDNRQIVDEMSIGGHHRQNAVASGTSGIVPDREGGDANSDVNNGGLNGKVEGRGEGSGDRQLRKKRRPRTYSYIVHDNVRMEINPFIPV